MFPNRQQAEDGREWHAPEGDLFISLIIESCCEEEWGSIVTGSSWEELAPPEISGQIVLKTNKRRTNHYTHQDSYSRNNLPAIKTTWKGMKVVDTLAWHQNSKTPLNESIVLPFII